MQRRLVAVSILAACACLVASTAPSEPVAAEPLGFTREVIARVPYGDCATCAPDPRPAALAAGECCSDGMTVAELRFAFGLRMVSLGYLTNRNLFEVDWSAGTPARVRALPAFRDPSTWRLQVLDKAFSQDGALWLICVHRVGDLMLGRVDRVTFFRLADGANEWKELEPLEPTRLCATCTEPPESYMLWSSLRLRPALDGSMFVEARGCSTLYEPPIHPWPLANCRLSVNGRPLTDAERTISHTPIEVRKSRHFRLPEPSGARFSRDLDRDRRIERLRRWGPDGRLTHDMTVSLPSDLVETWYSGTGDLWDVTPSGEVVEYALRGDALEIVRWRPALESPSPH